MTLARIVGAVGRTLIGLGLVTLLFAAYQLWGTGIQEARAQDRLENEFEELLAEAESIGITAESQPTSTLVPDPSTTTQLPDSSTAPTTTPDEAVDTISDFAYSAEQLALFFPDGGDQMASIQIPAIDVSKIVVEGVTVADLREGPGHYGATPFPGQPGNSAIAGHRTTYGAPFNRIDELSPGDRIQVTTIQGSFEYEVMAAAEAYPDAGLLFDDATRGHLIVSPSDTWVLDDFGDNRLTLTACHPKFSARERIIVSARLVEPPAPEVPRPAQLAEGERVEFVDRESGQTVEIVGSEELSAQAANEAALDEGLGWDTEALPDALLLAFVCIAIVAAAIVAAARWRKRLSYAAAALPFAVSLWFLFGQLDSLLPAY